MKDDLAATKRQIERLDQAFDEIVGEVAGKEVLEAAIVDAAQSSTMKSDGTGP